MPNLSEENQVVQSLPIQKREQAYRKSLSSRRTTTHAGVKEPSVVPLCCDPTQAVSGLLFELIKKCLPLQRSLACPAEQPFDTAHPCFPACSGREGGAWELKAEVW